MNRFLHGFFLSMLFLLFVGCSENEAVNASNDTTNVETETIENEQSKDDRIVSTTVAATEIFDALELDLVGIPTSYKELPERYEGVQEVGNPMSPDMELVKSLNPTDVISVTTLQTDLEPVFERVQLDATFLNLQSLDHMLSEIEALGEKYNRTEQAEALVSSIKTRLAEVESQVEGKESPTVLILLGVPGSYLVATEHSYMAILSSVLVA